MKKFSVLIAHYNSGKYFEDCYNSLVNQSFNDWEAVIVDDASTDASLYELLALIKGDSRFRVYTNPENKGCGYTKRRCMELAKGEICGYLDPDDALFSNALEDIIREFEKNQNRVAVYSQIVLCNEKLIPKENLKTIKQVHNDRFFFNYPLQISHFFAFRREVYLKTEGINPDLKKAVDQDLYLKILEYGNPVFIRKEMYKYRLHKKGISQDSSKESAKISFAKVILDSMKRRKMKFINGKRIPESFEVSDEIFSLLNYQNGIGYRLKIKCFILLRSCRKTIRSFFKRNKS